MENRTVKTGDGIVSMKRNELKNEDCQGNGNVIKLKENRA